MKSSKHNFTIIYIAFAVSLAANLFLGVNYKSQSEFNSSEEIIGATNDLLVTKNDQLMYLMECGLAQNINRTKPFFEPFDEIYKQTNEIIYYLHDIKNGVISTKKLNYELKKYKENLLKILQSESLSKKLHANISKIKDLGIPSNYSLKKNDENFKQIIGDLENKILLIANQIFYEIIIDSHYHLYSFDTVEVKVVPLKENLKVGDTYEAEILFEAVNRTNNYNALIFDKIIDEKSIYNLSKKQISQHKLKRKNNKIIYRKQIDSKGLHSFSGTIDLKTNRGIIKPYYFKKEYEVK